MKAVSIRGTVRNLGTEKLEEVFRENPYMNRIYPTEASRMALEVFCMTEGSGEFFDLSAKPIIRESFVISKQAERDEEPGLPERSKKSFRAGFMQTAYHITDACISCKKCTEVCPQSCIDTETVPFRIRREHCLHCGNCMTVCPAGAVKHV